MLWQAYILIFFLYENVMSLLERLTLFIHYTRKELQKKHEITNAIILSIEWITDDTLLQIPFTDEPEMIVTVHIVPMVLFDFHNEALVVVVDVWLPNLPEYSVRVHLTTTINPIKNVVIIGVVGTDPVLVICNTLL